MSIKLLNPEDIDKFIQKRKEQYEQIKDFVDNNPYHEPDEMGRILQKTIEKGFPAKPIRRLYNKEILQKIYYNMFDEDKIVECGKEINEIRITGPNDERKMKWLMITTNLHILQTIIEYNYHKRYTNKQIKKFNIINIVKIIATIWEHHFEWDIAF